jgi:hypothetical protein
MHCYCKIQFFVGSNWIILYLGDDFNDPLVKKKTCVILDIVILCMAYPIVADDETSHYSRKWRCPADYHDNICFQGVFLKYDNICFLSLYP